MPLEKTLTNRTIFPKGSSIIHTLTTPCDTRYDILRSHKGLTVRVNNTDAEGRLALADALSYGQQRYNPSTIVDVATLTGAIVVALGEHTAGLFSNNEVLEGVLRSVGKETHERVWVIDTLLEVSPCLCTVVLRWYGSVRSRFVNAGVIRYHVITPIPTQARR